MIRFRQTCLLLFVVALFLPRPFGIALMVGVFYFAFVSVVCLFMSGRREYERERFARRDHPTRRDA